ncbi:MAG: hypothetical protein HC806_03440, partial [Anaerolineae bacterium]|nr:hypothetical protein [Anaerolineae bacterium]
MANYIIRRLLMVPLLLVGTTVLIFLIISILSPTERSALWMPDIPRNENAWDSAIRKYCLDCPLHIQYWNWLMGVEEGDGSITGGILRGNFGYSRSGHQYIGEMIARRFPATIELA